MRRSVLVAALCALAVFGAACGAGGSGVSGESPAQILSSARQAFTSAHSVKITGHTEQNGMTGTFNITTFSNGDFEGTINAGTGTLKLVRIGNTDYLNSTKQYFAAEGAPAATAQALAGKWVYGPNSQLGLGSDFTLTSLSTQITKPPGKVTKGVTGTVNGQAAQSLHSSQGTLWVATSGPAYVLEELKTGSGGGVIYFTGWNEGTRPKAPAGAESLTTVESQIPAQ
jgi:hypothetical protein